MDNISKLENIGTEEVPFGPETERAIISLILDQPEFYNTISEYLTSDYFQTLETKWAIDTIQELYNETGTIPPREMVLEHAYKTLSVDDDYEPLIELIQRPCKRGEIQFVKNIIIKWAREQAFGILYDEEGLIAFENKDYDKLEQILDRAKKITDVSDNGLWFFEEKDLIFSKDAEKHYTCGFPRLDRIINEGGPTRKEVFCWMAGTGVGKSILLPHAGIANMKRGSNVLHITLELSKIKTAIRYAGAISNIEVHRRFEPKNKESMQKVIEKFQKSYGGQLAIYEFSPNEISINHIRQLIDQLRRQKNWNPDVLVIDYLDLLVAARQSDNSKEYGRQKTVSTEVRQLARNEDVLIFTATQTNRDNPNSKGDGLMGSVSGVNRVAESYGKLMPMDYVVSANQDTDEYNPDKPEQCQIRLFVAKNRNGQKNKIVPVKINYRTFRMEEKNVSKFNINASKPQPKTKPKK